MKRFVAKLLTLVFSTVALVSVGGPANADISFPSNPYWLSRLSVNYDNATPRLGDTVTFSANYDCIANGYHSFRGIRAANVGVTGDQYLGDLGSQLASVGSTHSLAITFSASGEYGLIVFVNCNIDASFQSYQPINTGLIVVNVPAVQNFVGAVQNVSVTPQNSSAFVTWGVANGATEYLVTASPSGQTCTTTQNFCTVTGLTNGSQQTFTVTAMNGNPAENSISPATEPVTINQPLQVSGYLENATWRVGSTVTLTPLITGVPTLTEVQWFRCDTIVPALPTQPNCPQIFGQISNSYTLTAADLGKYVSAFVHVTNQNSDAMKTIGNDRVTISAAAQVTPPVAGVDGLPRVSGISSREISLQGGTTIVINGTNLAGVESVTIGGALGVIISSTATSLTVKTPASVKAPGLADLTITNAKGSITSALALSYVDSSVASLKPKALSIKGFSAKSTKLTTAFKSKIRAFISANKGYTKLACIGDVRGVKKSQTQVAQATARAKSACAYAASLNKGIFIAASGKQSTVKGSISRLVTLTLSR